MNMKKGYALLSLVLVAALAGCGDKPTAAPSASDGGISAPGVAQGSGEEQGGETAAPSQEPDAESSAEATATPEPSAAPEAGNDAEDQVSETIDVFYTDTQIMELLPSTATITYENDDPSAKYKAAFAALQESGNDELVPLWGGMQLKNLAFENGRIIIDIHKPIEAQLGSGGEMYAMNALTQTFFQFQEVDSIELLLDGEQVESLMGHVELTHPITRDSQ